MNLSGTLSRVPPWAMWLAVITGIRITLAAEVPVLPEEAYHWNFARHLDWSYYDHPPFIAWSIALGRLFFGDTALGIRSLPLAYSVLMTAALARLSQRFYGQTAATWAVLLISIQPITSSVSGAGFPDSPMLLFWAVTMASLWNALEKGSPSWWLAAAAALGGAMLSKYTAAFLVPSTLIYLALSNRDRKWLASPWPYVGSFLALIVFSPVLYWNWTHDWGSFRFQSAGRLEGVEGLDPKAAITFLMGQWIGFLPLTFPLAMAAIGRMTKTHRPHEFFLCSTFLPICLFFGVVSWFRPARLLWAAPGHLALTVAMSGVAASYESRVGALYLRGREWLVTVSAALFLAAGFHAVFFLPWVPPFKELSGWQEASTRARSLWATMREDSFYLGIGRKYTCASELAFHLRAPFEVYGINLIGEGALQYDYWADAEALRGRDAIVVIESEGRRVQYLEKLNIHFETVEEVDSFRIPVGRMTLLETPPIVFTFFIARRYRPPSRTPVVFPGSASPRQAER